MMIGGGFLFPRAPGLLLNVSADSLCDCMPCLSLGDLPSALEKKSEKRTFEVRRRRVVSHVRPRVHAQATDPSSDLARLALELLRIQWTTDQVVITSSRGTMGVADLLGGSPVKRNATTAYSVA